MIHLLFLNGLVFRPRETTGVCNQTEEGRPEWPSPQLDGHVIDGCIRSSLTKHRTPSICYISTKQNVNTQLFGRRDRPRLVDGFPGAGAMSSRRKETRVRRQGT